MVEHLCVRYILDQPKISRAEVIDEIATMALIYLGPWPAPPEACFEDASSSSRRDAKSLYVARPAGFRSPNGELNAGTRTCQHSVMVRRDEVNITTDQ
jgi:hypothetical protein